MKPEIGQTVRYKKRLGGSVICRIRSELPDGRLTFGEAGKTQTFAAPADAFTASASADWDVDAADPRVGVAR